ncbi:hypothetical protein [Mycobacterium sp. ACS4331]|uniref:hypothetical protein n=1 Tax=Mycobacterium sp. ACS4331 TaxID=1834121 RepID=UPI0007FEFD48|nr:hypothetical protein [Mycobacterium sp. ACS4331]OBF10500.1 hypothetical protein A5727_21480 [Mycobacterium sp. ACS4331]
MGRIQPLTWFFTLEMRVQAKLLAHPHGYLSEAVAASIPRRADLVRDDDSRQRSRRWQLRSAEAIRLEEERLRLDGWWTSLCELTRRALLDHRGAQVPARYRDAVADLDPRGAPPSGDADAPFALTGITAAYVEMVAIGADTR